MGHGHSDDQPASFRIDLSISRTHLRGLRLRSHSQNRITVNPPDLSSLFTARSLDLFRWIFCFQYPTLLLGVWPHLGHPCQKHPSAKMAILAAGNTKSGHPGNSTPRTCQPLMPSWTRWARILRSVVALFADRIARILRLRVGVVLN